VDRLVAGAGEPDGERVRAVELVVAAVRRGVPPDAVVCVYCPVRNVERDGQQSEYETKLRSKVTPWSASSVRTFGITRIDSTVWSSVISTTTFGRLATSEILAWPADPLRPAAAAVPATRAAMTIQRVLPAMTGVSPPTVKAL